MKKLFFILFLAGLLPDVLGAATNQIDEVNVTTYGAVGDGVTDDTTAFNSAIAAAKSGNHNGIYVPLGNYVISTSLTLNGLELVGNFAGGWPADNLPLPTLLIRQYTAPAIILTNGASISGIALDYDQQTPVTSNAPAISLRADGLVIESVRIQNAYDGITTPTANTPGRARFSDILIVQPAHTGIQISKCYDFVQYKHIEVICPGAMSTGPAFSFGRSDEGSYTGLVASNCAVGIQFYEDTASGGGAFTGNFAACSFINCSNAITATGDHKIKITGSDFVSETSGIVINGTNAEVTLTGDLWRADTGPAVQVLQAANVIAEGCIFSRSAPFAGPLVQLNNATTVTVSACQFLPSSTGLELDSLLARAVIIGNGFEDGGVVDLMTSTKQIIANNVLNLDLSLAAVGQEILLSWPAWPKNLQVLSAASVTAPIPWQTLTNLPQSSNGTLTVTLPISGSPQQFFKANPP